MMQNDDFDPFAGPAILRTAPSTEHQREVWTASQLGEDASLAYSESIRLRLAGPLSVEALSRALDTLVERHEALRLSLSSDGLELSIAEAKSGQLLTTDLRNHLLEEQEELLNTIRRKEVETPFEFSRPSLFRAHLVALEAELHEFYFTAHHVICDGWSMGVLISDLVKLYNERTLGFEHEPLGEISLSDYALKKASESDEERSPSERYWVKTYERGVPTFDLPMDRPRPKRRGFASRREDRVLSSELAHGIKRLSAQSKTSPFSVLFGAYAVLLERLSGQSDLVVGVPFAGQAAEGHRKLVGHLVNMLPIRVGIDPNSSFSELLGRTKSLILDVQEHQNFTLGTLLSKLPIVRDPSRLPLAQVIFNFDQSLEDSAIAFQGLKCEYHSNPRSYETFDIFLNVVDRGGTLTLECQYQTELFDRDTVRRFLEAYERLLSSACDKPELAIYELDLLPAGDQENLARWNQTEAPLASEENVAELILARASAHPDRVAIVFEGREVTYGDLSSASLLLSQRLQRIGVRRGDYVGLCLGRSPELIIAALGIWRAGAAYIPLDPDYPKERLTHMVDDSQMAALVTSGRLESELGLKARRVLYLESPESDHGGEEAQGEPAGPLDPAYVIYTSGSTGKPKGVVVPHRALQNLIQSVAKVPGVSAEDVVLAITTLSFDIAVSEIWVPLFAGARIVLVAREVASDGAQLAELIASTGVTLIDATPATYRLLFGVGFQGSQKLRLICTGEAMPLDLGRRLLRVAREVYNGYGPTETTVWSTFWQAHEGMNKVLIGRPVDNTQIYILNEAKKPCPIGVAGEIYIAGQGVALGYLNRPELTKERFLPDPFVPGGRMYRTGDLGRYLSSSQIECLGRNDHQVKLRGFRIELGEIETALTQHPSVRDAVVVLRNDDPENPRLVAYLIAGESRPEAAVVRQHLKATLPDYMVPSAYVVLPSFPISPSGKVDRAALPAPDGESVARASEFVPARTKTEELLSTLFAELLKLHRVSVEDDFFALGGHSLLASQILGRLRRDHGIDLNFRKFFEAPTIEKLARLIDESRETGVKRTPLVKRSKDSLVPLTVSQERLVLLEEMHEAQRVAHHLPAAWEFRGPVDADRLEQSLAVLVSRHETLRTVLGQAEGGYFQRVLSAGSSPIARVDLREIAAESRWDAMMEQIHRISREPFELSEGPLFRSVLYRLEDERYVYFTLRHQLIWDGWSFDIFLGELCAAYGALARSEEPNLPALPVSYGDFAIYQRAELLGPVLSAQAEWWKKELHGAPQDLYLPQDFPRRTSSTYAGGNARMVLSKADYEALHRVAQKAGTTLFMVLYAAYVAVLARYSGQQEILVGLPVRGRHLPELEHLIGPFTNTMILRSRIDPGQSFLEHLEQVRQRSLLAMSHEEMPLEMLGADAPIVRALFSFQDARERPMDLAGVPITQVDVEHPAASNDLMIWAVQRPDYLVAIANYNAEIFESSSVERFLASFKSLLAGVIASPDARLIDLPLRSTEPEGDASGVLFAGSTSGGEWPRDGESVRGWLERLTKKFGSRAALVRVEQEGHLLTEVVYEHLLSEVEELRAGLAAMGLQKNSVCVGSCSDRKSAWLLALAAWSAGASVLTWEGKWPRKLLDRIVPALPPGSVFVTDNKELRAELLEQHLPVDLLSELKDRPRAPTAESVPLDPQTVLLRSLAIATDGSIDFSSRTLGTLRDAARGIDESIGGNGEGVQVASALASDQNQLGSLAVEILLVLSSGGTLSWARSDDEQERIEILAELPNSTLLTLGAGDLPTLLDSRAKLKSPVLIFGESDWESREKLSEQTRLFEVRSWEPLLSELSLVPFESRRGESRGFLLSSTRRLSVLDEASVEQPRGVLGALHVSLHGGTRSLGISGQIMGDGRVRVLTDERAASLEALGMRVELGFLERLLQQSGDLEACAVEVYPVGGQGRRLVAFVKPRAQSEFSESELRRRLRDELPRELIPKTLVELDKFPLNDSGELDRSRLPSPFAARGREHLEAKTENEKLLVRLVREVLGQTRISLSDNFFELGGHSLLCLRVVAELERETGKRISPRVLLLNNLGQAAKALELDSTRAQVPGPPARGAGPKADASLTGKVLKGLSGWLRGSN